MYPLQSELMQIDRYCDEDSRPMNRFIIPFESQGGFAEFERNDAADEIKRSCRKTLSGGSQRKDLLAHVSA